MSLLSLVRCRSSMDTKSLIHLIDKLNVRNAIKYQKLCSRHLYVVYRLQKYSTNDKKKDVTVSETSTGEVSTTFETIKENSKTLWYVTIVAVGLGLTGLICYILLSELFSSKSPNNVYAKAFDRCVKDEKVTYILGEPIKGYGEENSRGRRRFPSYLSYEKDGINHLRMKFYIKGTRKRGTVHLEMRENEKGKLEYRYLFVQLDEYPHTTIILEDNRNMVQMGLPLLPLKDTPDLL